MAKRRIGEQSADRDYILYLQKNMGPDFYVTPEWKRKKLLTKEEFDAKKRGNA